MPKYTTGLIPSKFASNKVLNYSAKTAIAHTDNTTTTFAEDGAIFFYNPHTAATVYNLPMFNGELYDSNNTKIMDLNFNTNTPSSTFAVTAGMKYKCLKWSVITVYASTEDEVGSYQSVDTNCALYFVPYTIQSVTNSSSSSGSDITTNANFVNTYNEALGDTSALDAILGEESESESA